MCFGQMHQQIASPAPGKCEVTLEDEIECDMPAKDVCSLVFTTFLNPLFKDNDDLDCSDDESLPDEDVPVEEFKIYSNPLFDEDEINSDKLDPHCFNVESDFVESLLNQEIRLIENFLYDNSFPRPPEELNAKITDTIIESILLPIPVQDGNSQQEEIDIVTSSDDVLPPSVENDDDYDLLLEEADLFLFDNSIPPDNLSNSRPPPEPPNDNFDLEPEDYPPEIEVILCRILSWFPRPSYLLIDFSLGKSISMIYIAYLLIVPPLCSKF
uniref:Reverse transcriptase domain-containing protein n=1 Tax=Tanacetum cinerariifolium TaxID=118510 RepID=A0A6L2JXM6_TANCI|nr:hypothetical protein [Tanacetum cinerariifolium]